MYNLNIWYILTRSILQTIERRQKISFSKACSINMLSYIITNIDIIIDKTKKKPVKFYTFVEFNLLGFRKYQVI